MNLDLGDTCAAKIHLRGINWEAENLLKKSTLIFGRKMDGFCGQISIYCSHIFRSGQIFMLPTVAFIVSVYSRKIRQNQR
jgi:hypothetical protein